MATATFSGGQKALAIDSAYEQLTETAMQYREKHVYTYLGNRGLQVKILQGPDATQNNVAQFAPDPSMVFITGVGHGTATSFTKDLSEDVFAVGAYDPQEVRGKIVHLFACETAKMLGPNFVTNGCLAFFGYSELFTYDQNSAEMFLECDGAIDLALADGLDASNALARAKDTFDKYVKQLLANPKTVQSAHALQFNRDSLRLLGDPTAKLIST